MMYVNIFGFLSYKETLTRRAYIKKLVNVLIRSYIVQLPNVLMVLVLVRGHDLGETIICLSSVSLILNFFIFQSNHVIGHGKTTIQAPCESCRS